MRRSPLFPATSLYLALCKARTLRPFLSSATSSASTQGYWRDVAGKKKIRHYGFLQNHGKTARLNAVRKEMKLQPLLPKINVPVAVRMLEQYGHDITQCPKCKTGKLQLIAIVYPKEVAVKLSLAAEMNDPVTVSYTHLTLPTNREV